ncbi:Tad domain-containing protein [Clostridiaceae bacterium 35-E11]
MLKMVKNIFHEEKGNVLVLVSLIITLLLGMTGLVIDGGALYTVKSHLEKSARAAVLSGAQELTAETVVVASIVKDVLTAHHAQDHLVSLNIELGKYAKIHLKQEVPLTFMNLFGFHSAPVEVTATAQILQMGRANGAAPLGIDESIPLEYYKEYQLKVDQTEVSHGNFGVLALGGPGSQTYEDNLRNGYQGEIKLGDIIETQTGNIAGKTRTVINERISACPYSAGDMNHRDCPRILLVPIYQPYFYTTNQLKEIKIKGFAYFYIMEPMSNNDTSITGMFIKKVGTGFTDATALNRGAYSIKLTE